MPDRVPSFEGPTLRWVSPRIFVVGFSIAAAALVYAWSGLYPLSILWSERPGLPEIFLLPIWDQFARTWLTNAGAVAAVVAFEFGCWGLGRRMIVWVRREPIAGLAGALFAIGIGNGLLGTAILGMGLNGLVIPAMIAITLAAAFALSVADLVAGSGGTGLPVSRVVAAFKSLSLIEWGLVLLCVIFAGTTFLLAMAPPSFYDTVVYHLAIPEQYLIHHKISHLSHILSANLPFLQEMQYMVFLGLGNDIGCKLLSWTDGVLCVLAIYALALPLTGRGGALLAAAAFWVQAPTGFLQIIAMVEMKLTFFGVLAIVGALRALGLARSAGPRRGWLILTGVVLGFGHATKYPGVFASVLIIGWVLVAARNRRDSTSAIARAIGLIVVAALVATAPWLVKNIAFTGNPVFPLLQGVLGGLNWDPEHYRQWLVANRNYGVAGGGIMEWLGLPLKVFTASSDFGSVALNPLPLIFLPILVFLRRAPGAIKFLAAYAVFYGVIWALTSQQSRYLIPAVPAAAVVIGFVVTRAIDHRVPRIAMAIVAGWIIFVAGTWQIDMTAHNRTMALYTLGHMSRDRLLSQRLLYYDTVRFANRRIHPRSRILFIGSDDSYYLLRGRICNRMVERSTMGEMSRRAGGLPRLMTSLKQLGVTHLLVNDARTREFAEQGFFDWTPAAKATFVSLWRSHLKLLYSSRRVALFELRSQPLPIRARKHGTPGYLYPASVLGRVDALARSADELMRVNDITGAAAIADQIVNILPEVSFPYTFRAAINANIDRRDSAIADFRTAIRMGYPPAETHGRLARLLEADYRPGEALVRYAAALEIDPTRRHDLRRAIDLAQELDRPEIAARLMGLAGSSSAGR